jgi:peptidoglycan/xylan/chitin deacetylase (PgdA/CDA1 family)
LLLADQYSLVAQRLLHILLTACLAVTASCAGGSEVAKTVVILGFDDGTADQFQVLDMLSSYGLHATFYVSSGLIGRDPKFMTWQQVQELANSGHEIAGHSLTHQDLTMLTEAEKMHEICDDRENLVRHGFEATSFAYPYGKSDAITADVVRRCGYKSGRLAWGLDSGYSCPDGCNGNPRVESLPPPDLFAVRAVSLGSNEVTLQALQQTVLGAEDGGPGVLPLYFHNVCTTPCIGAFGWVEPTSLAAFLEWLTQRRDRGTLVRTNAQAFAL